MQGSSAGAKQHDTWAVTSGDGADPIQPTYVLDGVRILTLADLSKAIGEMVIGPTNHGRCYRPRLAQP